MKKTKIDRSIDTEALGFQVRESYKTARTSHTQFSKRVVKR